MAKDDKYFSKERADAAKRSNARHANMARAYASRPTLTNMIKAAYNYYLSKPALGGEDESGLELNKGIAPTPGRGRGFRPQNVRDAANKAKQTYNQMSSAARRTYGRQTQVNDKIPYNQNNMFRGFTLGKGNNPKPNPYAGATSSKQSFEYQSPTASKADLNEVFDDDVSFWTRLNRNKLPAAAGLAIAAGGLKAGDWYILNNVVGKKNNNNTSTNNTTNTKNNNTSTNRPTNVNSTNVVRTDSLNTDSTRTITSNSTNTNNRNQVVRDSIVTNRDSTTNNRTQTTVKPTVTVRGTTKVNNTTTTSKSNSTKSSTNTNKSNNSNKERKHLEEVPGVYDIKKGDNLWNIAKRYTGKGSNYKELLKLNPNIKNEDLIYAGDKLRIPESWLKK